MPDSDDIGVEILQMLKERHADARTEVAMHACLAAAMALAGTCTGVR